MEVIVSILSGKCLCNKVSYSCNSEPTAIFGYCHCKDCRKATGSVFGTNLFFSENNVEINGKLSSFKHISDTGSTMTKFFCPCCGSLNVWKKWLKKNVISIRAGTVDQINKIKPTINIFMDSKVPSTSIDKKLKQTNRMPIT